MNRVDMLNKVKVAMSEKRFEHTMHVEKTAIELAKIYHVSEKKASIAAILHDYAKHYPLDKAKEIIIKEKMDLRLLNAPPSLWHGYIGAYFAETEFGIHDPEILQAICLHTTGSGEMTTLDKLIYLADYIEPGRDFPGVEKARKLTYNSLDEGMLFALSRTITYLIEKKKVIFSDTFFAYNYFVQLENKRSC